MLARMIDMRAHASGGMLELVGEPFVAPPEGRFLQFERKRERCAYGSAPKLFCLSGKWIILT